MALKQRDDKPLQDYLHWFNLGALQVKGLHLFVEMLAE